MKPLMTQFGANKRLAAYLVAGGVAYFLDHAQTPPHGWAAVRLALGVIGALAVIYRAYIDGSDPEAKANAQASDQTSDQTSADTKTGDTNS